MALRDHQPVVINQFNGLFNRGNIEEVPNDHFTDGENFKFIGATAFGWRDGIDIYQNTVAPLGHVTRIYNFITPTYGSTLLCLTDDGVTGKIYHVINNTTVFGPILQINGMTDFAFVPINGRAFISPFASFTVGSLTIEKGMQNQFLYVYQGDGTAARKAAGTVPGGVLAVGVGAIGNIDAGIHVYGVVGETDSGYLSAPVAFKDFNNSAGKSVDFGNIPLFSGSQWVKRHIVSTKTLATFNGDTTNQIYFFIPNATVNDNVTTSLLNVSFFDADLLEDASHLVDNYPEIPAGANLCLYHDRLCLSATFTDISLTLVSAQGEPEAISTIDGLIIVPLDGNPITNAQEMRDVLYIMKRNRTVSYSDNGDAPSSWPLTVIDQALGCPVHGIATVIDSGSSSVDFLIVATFQGIMLFNGQYQIPELSWKMWGFWLDLDRNNFKFITILNDPIGQNIYCTLPDFRLLIGNYANGMTPKDIRWTIHRFDIKVNAIALVNINDLIIAAEGRLI